MAEKKKKKQKLTKRIKKKVMGRLKKIVKYVGYRWVLPLSYKWYSRRPINHNLVVFADHQDRDMPDNFLNLLEMCERNGFECVVLSGRPFSEKLPTWQRRKAKLKFHFKFIKLFAQCHTLFLVEHFPPADIVEPRQGTQVVQLWHGCGILKKWGYAVTATSANAWGMSKAARKRHIMYRNQTLSTVSSASEKVVEGYRAAFDCNVNIIKPLGCPRTDIYFDEEFKRRAKEKIDAMFPQIGKRKIILYAPTFRGKTIKSANIKLNFNFAELKESLSSEYVFLTKFHPQMEKNGLPESGRLQTLGFIFDVTKQLNAEEALCAADILITDYSSIMFEYYLLERPVISYIYDIDTYDKDRGLFYPYDQLAPGPYVFTQEDLVEKLLTVDEWFDIERIREFKEEVMSACDGHSTERIYNYVFHRQESRGR